MTTGLRRRLAGGVVFGDSGLAGLSAGAVTSSFLASRYWLSSEAVAGGLAGGSSSPNSTWPVIKLAEQSAAAKSVRFRRRAMRRDRAISTIASPLKAIACADLFLFSAYRGYCGGVLEKR